LVLIEQTVDLGYLLQFQNRGSSTAQNMCPQEFADPLRLGAGALPVRLSWFCGRLLVVRVLGAAMQVIVIPPVAYARAFTRTLWLRLE
jgi:hypothetical protein